METIDDRRQHIRFPCNPPLKASFESSEGSLSALVEDISTAGARLRIPYSNQRIPFLLQGEFDYTFHSDNTSARYHGKTAWVQRVDADFVWGIEFIPCNEPIDECIDVSIRQDVQPMAQ